MGSGGVRRVPLRNDNQLGEMVAVGCHCRGFRCCSTFDMWMQRGSTRKDGVEARCSVKALPSRQPRCVECGIVLLLSSSSMLRASVGEVPTLARGEKQATRDEFRTWLRIQGQSQSEEGIFFFIFFCYTPLSNLIRRPPLSFQIEQSLHLFSSTGMGLWGYRMWGWSRRGGIGGTRTRKRNDTVMRNGMISGKWA